jgi:hypothetical protein
MSHEHDVSQLVTPPPAETRAPPLRGIREGEEKINQAAFAPNSCSISP